MKSARGSILCLGAVVCSLSHAQEAVVRFPLNYGVATQQMRGCLPVPLFFDAVIFKSDALKTEGTLRSLTGLRSGTVISADQLVRAIELLEKYGRVKTLTMRVRQEDKKNI